MAARNSVAGPPTTGAKSSTAKLPAAKDFLKANKQQPMDARKSKKTAGAHTEQRRASAEAVPGGLNSLLEEYTASLEAPDETTLLKQQIKEMQRRAERAEAAVNSLTAQMVKQSAQIAELIDQLRLQNSARQMPASLAIDVSDAQAEQETEMEGVAADATNSTKRPLSPSPSTSDGEEEGAVKTQPFTVVGKDGKAAKKKQRRASNDAKNDIPSTRATSTPGRSNEAPPADALTNAARQAAPARRRAFAFVLIGLSADQRQQLTSIHKVLGVPNSAIRRTNIMKSGNVIIEPTDETGRATLEATTLPANLQLKPLGGSSRAPATSQYVVLKGVHEEIPAEKIEEILKLPCKRLLSASNGGKPTLKVKVTVKDAARQKEMLMKGVTVGSLHFKAAEYKSENTSTLLCHKCYSPGHIAKVCEQERLCRRCGGGHLVKDCTSPAECINCGGGHEATHPSCPKILQQKDRKEARTLTYAAAAKRSGDKVEMLQLAGCIAACLVAFNKRASASIDHALIYKDVASSVSATYRVSIKPTHVKAQVLQVADTSDATQHE